MKKNMKPILVLLAVSILTSCFLLASLPFAQELPKPGEVINKSNYKKYAHLFPEEFLAGFENGWDLINPISIKVSETKPSPIPKAFLALSEKNRGKFTLNSAGRIQGGYDYVGLPFPGLTETDTDFATKLMYNYSFRYGGDDRHEYASVDTQKRKGEPMQNMAHNAIWLYCYGRLFEPPKPVYKTPIGLYKSMLFTYLRPSSVKDTIMLTYRYTDQDKADDTWIYLPTLRRVLRGESGQRSTPTLGSVQALDDYYVFDGKVQEFTYKFVKRQKVLAIADSITPELVGAAYKAGKEHPFPVDNYEIRDVYVIDIIPKDPKYPQSKKQVYVDVENSSVLYYGVAWDRAGKVWKLWEGDAIKAPMPDGSTMPGWGGQVGIDLQFGMFTYYSNQQKLSVNKYVYTEFMPSALLKRVK